jgi:Eukaryotic aspartyl protease
MSALRKSCCSECCCPLSHLMLPLRAQTFNLVLDTGSSDLWFATTACAICPKGIAVLDPTKSSTFVKGNQPVNLTYGSGSAAGVVAQDTVSMGPYTVKAQILGANLPLSSNLRLSQRALCTAKSRWRSNMSANRLSAWSAGR